MYLVLEYNSVYGMHLLKSGIKSSKIATLAALILAIAYAVPEFIESTHNARSATYGISKGLFANSIPLPFRKPGDMPKIQQPEQFDLASLDAALIGLDYRLKNVRNDDFVPRVFVKQMPVDILDIPDVQERKNTFIKVVLPLILNTNEKIEARRERLSSLLEAKDTGQPLAEKDSKWLAELATRYREDMSNPAVLIVKVDKVPVAMALAQSIEESGWGTSRFAREGNALFGQRVWATGKGIVPEERAESETHEVKAFKSIGESIEAYVHNLNTHPAYAEFRDARARRHLEPEYILNGLGLIGALHAYSEKGQEYVDNLRSLIESNRLTDFESATLAPERLADSR